MHSDMYPEQMHSDIGWFARHILGKPLYPYQEQVGNAILSSIREGRGRWVRIS